MRKMLFATLQQPIFLLEKKAWTHLDQNASIIGETRDTFGANHVPNTNKLGRFWPLAQGVMGLSMLLASSLSVPLKNSNGASMPRALQRTGQTRSRLVKRSWLHSALRARTLDTQESANEPTR